MFYKRPLPTFLSWFLRRSGGEASSRPTACFMESRGSESVVWNHGAAASLLFWFLSVRRSRVFPWRRHSSVQRLHGQIHVFVNVLVFALGADGATWRHLTLHIRVTAQCPSFVRSVGRVIIGKCDMMTGNRKRCLASQPLAVRLQQPTHDLFHVKRTSCSCHSVSVVGYYFNYTLMPCSFSFFAARVVCFFKGNDSYDNNIMFFSFLVIL